MSGAGRAYFIRSEAGREFRSFPTQFQGLKLRLFQIASGFHVNDDGVISSYMEPDHDHDLDWPWTLYFNGEPVQRWANCWNLFELSGQSHDLFVEYPWLVDSSDFERFCHRMDLAHQVDSEDPVIFRILTLSMLVLLLRHEVRLPASGGGVEGVPVSVIFESLRDGIAAMHTRTLRDGFSFWSVGYQDDQERLAIAIDQSRLPPPPENHVPPPHIRERNQLAEDRLHSLRCELLDLMRGKRQPKHFRRFVHELSTRIRPHGP